MVGTPDYMAPEVRENSWELDCDLDTPPPPEVKQFAPWEIHGWKTTDLS